MSKSPHHDSTPDGVPLHAAVGDRHAQSTDQSAQGVGPDSNGEATEVSSPTTRQHSGPAALRSGKEERGDALSAHAHHTQLWPRHFFIGIAGLVLATALQSLLNLPEKAHHLLLLVLAGLPMVLAGRSYILAALHQEHSHPPAPRHARGIVGVLERVLSYLTRDKD